MITLTINRIGVVGAGSWGTTVANLLAGKGIEVRLWAREAGVIRDLPEGRVNARYLPGIALHPRLCGVTEIGDALGDADLAVFAIPAQSLRAVAREAQPFVAADVPVVNLAKGLEESTGARCSEILLQELKHANPVGILSGPNIAWEVCRGVPSKAVVACSSYRHLGLLQDVFSTPCFKVYENPDLPGTELGGALKNVIAIMAGIGDGLGYGVNTKAAVVTRGLQEMIKVGVIMGGHRDTFFGLSGIGDLMATALSEHSRNRAFGEQLGRSATLAEAEASLNGRVAEGVKTTRALFEIKSEFGLDTPIVDTLYRILYEGLPAREGYMRIWNPGEKLEGA